MKTYISDIIGDDYIHWGKRKIFIEAPTGTGKTTFVIKKLLEFHRGKRQKLLVLCNRRLLREQYLSELLDCYDSLSEMRETVEVTTYQALSQAIDHGATMQGLLFGYAAICLDEVHYFHADSDFNAQGTYFLLQELMRVGLDRQMVFISATMWCIKPWIQKILSGLKMRIPYEESRDLYQNNVFEEKEYRLDSRCTYEGLRCIAVPDLETLCEKLGHAEGKSVIFFDDKAGADEIYALLQTRGGLGKSEIAKFNADNLDSAGNSEVISELVMKNTLLPKVLITTSVLDNGVSIKDEEMENIVIITESKVSFLQMLGRVRRECTPKLNLYLLIRSEDIFKKRAANIHRMLDVFDVKTTRELYNRQKDIFLTMWEGKSELADWYRTAYPRFSMEDDLLYDGNLYTRIKYTGLRLTVNLFAKEKLEQLWMEEQKLYRFAVEDPVKVLFHQLEWIGKTSDDLEFESSTYLPERKQNLREMLLEIQNFTNKELGVKKKEIAVEFGKDLLVDYDVRNRSISTDKLERIANEFSLTVDVKMINNRTHYSVVPKTVDEEVAVCCSM